MKQCLNHMYSTLSTIIIWLILFVDNVIGDHDMAVHPCLLFCKDNHMKEMESEWSSNFAFPLQSMLGSTKNESAVYIRATEICRSNEMLLECLQECELSKERTLLTLGLEPWREICANLPTLQQHLPCWRSNIDYLSSSCEEDRNVLRDLLLQLASGYSFSTLQKICEGIEQLSSCAVKTYNTYCGLQSAKFIQRSYEIDKLTNLRMLQMKFAKLPESCEINIINTDQIPVRMQRNTVNNDSISKHIVTAILLILIITCIHIP